jgi:hypothetical protein
MHIWRFRTLECVLLDDRYSPQVKGIWIISFSYSEGLVNGLDEVIITTTLIDMEQIATNFYKNLLTTNSSTTEVSEC